MLCSNQQQLLDTMPFLADAPPVFVDWLPWNHTFGGNHNYGLTLFNGGTLYIDDGKPTPAGIAVLNNEVTRQASAIAYVDDFLLMMWVTLLAAPLLLLLRKPA